MQHCFSGRQVICSAVWRFTRPGHGGSSMHSGPSGERSAPGSGHGRVGLWNPCCKCLFSGVPDDMLLHHLYPFLEKRDLARSSAVCTRWSFMCSFPSLWRRVSTPDDGIHTSAQLLAVLGRHGSGVTALRVHRAVELHDDDLGA